MATKKHPSAKNKTVSILGFGQVKMTSEGLVIEGLANKFVVDRGNEIIATNAWDLENYKKNPVILYNHGFDPQLGSTPVGKAVEIKPTDAGLYIKAQLASIDDPLINRIRGLVQEKILRAFSVGFNPIEADSDAKSGVKTITKAELFEVSIVGVPMNQDSLFEVTSKMFKSMDQDTLRLDILNRKGAWAASAIHNAVYEKQEKEKLKREDILAAIMEKAEIDEDTLTDVLAGNTTPIPEPVLMAVSEILGISMDELKKLDAGDKELESNEEKQPKDDSEETAEKPKEGTEEGGQAAIEIQLDGAEKDLGKGSKETNQDDAGITDFQKCVSDKIRDLIAEGKEQDQAVAIAITACSEGKSIKTNKKDYEMFFKLADSLKQAEQEGVDTVPTTEVTTDRTLAAENDFGSPMLDAAKQTNVLLGALLAEMQKMSKKLDGLVTQPADAGTDLEAGSGEASEPPAEPETAKSENAPALDGTPTAEMDEPKLLEAQKIRSEKYGIEVVDGSPLGFAEGSPSELSKYGDPVNLKFVIDSSENSSMAREEFKKSADDYSDNGSKANVHSRIVDAMIALGAEPSYDEEDALDALLSKELKDKLKESNIKTLDSYRKRLENVKNRLLALGAG